MRTTFGVMEHLATEAVVAFADGELGMTAYQRAAAHLHVCAECAADLDAQQCARTAVRSAAPLVMPAALLGMLCRIPETSAPNRKLLSAPAQSPLPSAPRTEDLPRPARVGAATSRTRRSFPLGVLAVSALAVGVLSVTAGATGPAAPAPPGTDQPVQAAAVAAEHGAQVIAASNTAHARLVSFGVMFTGSAEPSRGTQLGSAPLRSAPTILPQTGTSP